MVVCQRFGAHPLPFNDYQTATVKVKNLRLCSAEETKSPTSWMPWGWSWERFCEGLQEFVDGARDRKEKRAVHREDRKIPPSAVGVESLIVAAACYELKILSTGDMVLRLSLLAVRKRYQHLGIGSYIMELLKTQSVVGKYDTLVAHADTDAIGFFKIHRLTDDPLLNDQFKELNDDWTNSTLMCYLPPFTTDIEMRNRVFSMSLQDVEMDLDLAKSQALFAYQRQVMCVKKLLEEVKILRVQLDLQHEEVDHLKAKLQQEKQKCHDIENKFLMYRLKNAKELLDNIPSDQDNKGLAEQKHSNPRTQEQEAAQSEEPLIQTPEGAGV